MIRRIPRIAVRLFAFNLLVVFAPIAGVLYLDVYEANLRQAQEDSLVQQARLVAVAIGATPALDADRASALFGRVAEGSEARFRLYDRDGRLVADSARHAKAALPASYAGSDSPGTRSRALYRLGAVLVQSARHLWSRAANTLYRREPAARTADSDVPPEVPPEVRTALSGRYGAATRRTPNQRSLTLFSAVPVRHGDAVVGAVVASQSTFRVLSALYAVRLRLFEVVVASLVAAAVLTAVAATTIVWPLTRLRAQASLLAQRRGPLPEVFEGASRRDEVGSLARALGELARRTNDHVRLVQSFAADVSHELKNPLASIRTAAEMMAGSESPDERARFLEMMTRDVGRLERLVSGLRDVARLEGQIDHDLTERIPIAPLVARIVASFDGGPPGRRVEMIDRATQTVVVAAPERLVQVFENLVGNAVSFAPPDTSVTVVLEADLRWVTCTISDRGPGIPDAHLERIFERFFTYRPDDRQREHVGLGLAIARQIVESYGGTVTAANNPDGGARFIIRLPRAPG